jgi:hypothetical protein
MSKMLYQKQLINWFELLVQIDALQSNHCAVKGKI